MIFWVAERTRPPRQFFAALKPLFGGDLYIVYSPNLQRNQIRSVRTKDYLIITWHYYFLLIMVLIIPDLFPQSPFRRETGASRIVMFKMVIYTFVNLHTFSTSVD